MDLNYSDFCDDLSRITKTLVLIKKLQAFSAIPWEKNGNENDFISKAFELHKMTANTLAHLKVVIGTVLLYISGRFEKYVRSQFEELCDSIAIKCNSYDSLPKGMRNNLIKCTADVIANPRKFGHAEKGAEAFIIRLADNIRDRTKLEEINSQCLSITYENMRSDTISALFNRIDEKDIWKTISEQAEVKTYFETNDTEKAKKECCTKINVIMDERNKIAHSTGNIEWPSEEKIEDYIKYFEAVAKAFSAVIQMLKISLPNKLKQKMEN